MQPSSPTYASACHSRPFPLSSGLKVHMALCLPHCTPQSHRSPLPGFLPPSGALPLRPVCPSLPALSLSALPWCLGVLPGTPLPCLASLHALFAVFPFASCSQACGRGAEGSRLRVRAGLCPPLQVGWEFLLRFGEFLQQLCGVRSQRC